MAVPLRPARDQLERDPQAAVRPSTGSAPTRSAATCWPASIWGTRASLAAGIISVSISLAIGVPIGLAAGFIGGLTDGLISRITDAFLACPFLILAIAMAAFLGPSLTNAMIAIGVSATPIFVRLTRAQVINVKVEDYVEAARALGNPPWRIAIRHVLPNVVPPLIVQTTLAIAAAIIAEASLSFLGLGQQPPAPSWGSMLNTAKNYMDQAPWMAIWPGAGDLRAGAGVQPAGGRAAGCAGSATIRGSPRKRLRRSASQGAQPAAGRSPIRGCSWVR